MGSVSGEAESEDGTWPWILTLFGTAVGAGILYLPLQAGISGMAALVFLSLLIFPIIYYSHHSVVELLALGNERLDYSGMVAHYMGKFAGVLVIAVFFITFFAVLFSYVLGLNANLGAYGVDLGITETNWARGPFLTLMILCFFALLQMINRRTLLRIVAFASTLMIFFLFAISMYLIPFWSVSSWEGQSSFWDFITDALRIFPILTLSFVFLPAMSSMVMSFRKNEEALKDRDLNRLKGIVWKTSVLLLFFVLLFVFSCVLSLSPDEFGAAIQDNLNCLTVLSYKEGISPVLANIGVLVGLAALFTSFIGVFFAVHESAYELVTMLASMAGRGSVCRKKAEMWISVFIYLMLWGMAAGNPSVMDVFGFFVAPLVAIFLFILPVVILVRVRGRKMLKSPSHLFVFFSGVFMLFSYGLGSYLQG
ncbi:hypothetical protein OOT00_15420 [Desulfobotulus sp. H1]|uniref:Amino acid transporter transmembrane domain-containing protein n=1 Tax=Desulfobotulus pelophilus TaxID=2823377 RepID=A0ABT3ND46_9BACT|nr:aromatic amino acid transport family protein [Desulfobotulus pelophilus]MCW7755373.1 hypothetical protein [Desulfobotulus pelophilus]